MLALYSEVMDKKNLTLIRDLLLKTFLIGLVFGVLLFVMTVTFWEQWSSFVFAKFQIPKSELGEMFVNSLLYLRLYLIFVILVPGIAVHWTIKSKG